MESLFESLRTATRGLVLLGIVLAWATHKESPPVLETARRLTNGILFRPAHLTGVEDPLADRPAFVRKPLGQYRHLYKHSQGIIDANLRLEQKGELSEISVAAVLDLAEPYLGEGKQADAYSNASKLSELVLSGLRRDLGRLQSWLDESNLNRFSSLGDLQQRLNTQIQIPMLDQPVDVNTLMMGCGVALVLLHAYLGSLLRTIEVSIVSMDSLLIRSWVGLHYGFHGSALFRISYIAPTVIWIAHHVAIAITPSILSPPIRDLTLGVSIIVSCAWLHRRYTSLQLAALSILEDADETEKEITTLDKVSPVENHAKAA
ncbi:MAG: hypothetical protein AAF664_03925 [Planctomycetota bacterium]